MMNWLYRPVARGYALLRELQDGTYDLTDIALMNELIDIDDENTWRASNAKRQ